MTYNLLRNARIRNSTSCRYDTNDGYSIRWDTEGDYRGYTTYSGVTARLVSNGYYFMVTTSSGGYITSPGDVMQLDAGIYTDVSVDMRIYPGFGHVTPTKARLDFWRSDDIGWESSHSIEFSIVADNAYREYIIDLSRLADWRGVITRLKLFPIINGDVGQQVFVRSLRASSPNVYACSSHSYGSACNKYAEYSHPCPFIGRGGVCTSEVLPPYVTVASGVNDRLIVDINEYGNQAITLEPIVNASLDTISRDIENKLNLIGIGGYNFARCTVVNGSLQIEADTPSSASTVEVRQVLNGSTGVLGFFDAAGNSLYTASVGEDAASRYEAEGTVQVERADLDRFYSQDTFTSAEGFSLNPEQYALQGGWADYTSISRDTSIEFRYKTFIDFNNPITENGLVTSVFFSGTIHPETAFRIYRQRLDGSLTKVASVPFNRADTEEDLLFSTSCNVRVAKGDLVGLYSASLHSGKETSTPNFSYFLYDGNLDSISESPRLVGDGDVGAPLFCRGSSKKTKAVVSIEFDFAQPIESLTVTGSEDVREEILELTRVSGVRVSGYTGVDSSGNQAPSWTGLSNILDREKLDMNGVSASAYPLWVDYGSTVDYDYTEAGIIIDVTPGINVFFDLYRVVVYFAAEKNIKHFTLDYPQNTDVLDVIRSWSPVAGNYNQVYIDGSLSPTTRYFYKNPSFVTVEDYHEDYVALGYRYIDFRFTPVKARSIRYRGYLDRSGTTIDHTSTAYADFPIYINPRIQEIEVYAKSTPKSSIVDNFALYSSTDLSSYVQHTSVEELSSTAARFLVGYPVKGLKFVILPASKLSIGSVSVETSIGDKAITTNVSTEEHSHCINSALNKEEISSFVVTNSSDIISNYSIGIVDDFSVDESLVLWNKLESVESCNNSEIGPGASVCTRNNFEFIPTNVAYKAKAYMLDLLFLNGSLCYSSYDSEFTWEFLGDILVDGSIETGLTNESAEYLDHPYVYAVIDCGELYTFESVELVKMDGFLADYGWSTSIFYSDSDVDDPSLVTGWTTDSSSVRWIRVSSHAVAPGSGGIASLAYLRVTLSPFDSLNYSRLPWLSANFLTNGTSGSVLSPANGAYSGMSSYYCVDLGTLGEISGAAFGPTFPDITLSTPGAVDSYNMLDGTNAHPSFSFSGTTTSVPKRVRWGGLGKSAPGNTKWVLVKASLCDQIAVFFSETSSKKAIYDTVSTWESTPTSRLSVWDNYCEPFHSIRCDSTGGEKLSMSLFTPLGYDNNLAYRDVLVVCLYVSDVGALDSGYGYIKALKATSEDITLASYSRTEDPSNFFVWDLSDFYSGLQNGWNYLQLPFTANNEVGDTRFVENLSESSMSVKRRSRFMGINFSFKSLESKPLFVAIDNLSISRAYFPRVSSTSTGLYLAGDDYVKFPLGRFNHVRGCLEFSLVPDWSRDINCNSCDSLVTRTLVTLSNPYGYRLVLFMTSSGFKIFFSDGTNTLTLVDNSLESVIAATKNHVAIVWDLSNDKLQSVFELYINGKLSSYYPRASLQGEFDLRPLSDTTLVFGGKVWSGYGSKDVTGLDGVVSDVKLYTYPKRNFSSTSAEGKSSYARARELVEISLDGVNFYAYGSSSLPLLKHNVVPDSSFPVYVKSKNIDSLMDDSFGRIAFLDVIRSYAG